MAKERPFEQVDSVLIIGSGKNAVEADRFNLPNTKYIAVNHAWKATTRWDYWLHSGDFKGEKFDGELGDNRKIISASKPAGNTGYNEACKQHGGVRETGYSIMLNASYWVMEFLSPKRIGFIGADMNYQTGPEGETAFYGVGVDIQRNKVPDPDRMAEKYGKDDPAEYLRKIYMRFYDIAQQKEIEVYNLSNDPSSRLPYPKIDWREFEIK